MRSFEDSLTRMGMNTVDLLLIHDLDHMHFEEAQLGHHLTQLFTSGWRVAHSYIYLLIWLG